ncbi:MAG TPA: 2OG-Fe(II) oxygenase family protein [Candidatus Angelobacter sp.]
MNLAIQTEVPTIDISPLFGGDRKAKMEVAQQIDEVCRGSGFFYAANHGIDLQALQTVTAEFHQSMTEAEKFDLAIHAYNPDNLRSRNGYYMATKGKKANQSFCYLNPSFTEQHPMIATGTPMHEVNNWPSDGAHPGLRAFYEAYYWDVFQLSAVLLRGFALALGREESFFDSHFTAADTLSAVSLIHYPYLENYPPVKTGPDGKKLSFEDHQDVSVITVLYQTPVPNLQMETPAGFCDIPVSGDCFLVNCGTYMPYLTNNYYRAPVHRVAFINAERLSIPFFVHLGYKSILEPFTPSNPKGIGANTAIPYGEYLSDGWHKLIAKNGQT